MALIKCPECKREISDKSKQCIHCGFPLNLNQQYNNCIINGIECEMSWLISTMSEYTLNEKQQIKCILDNTVNKTQKEKIEFAAKLEKNNEFKFLHEVHVLAEKIQKTTPLSFDSAQEFLLMYLTDDKIPSMFNGESYEAWSNKISRSSVNIPKCPMCGSTNISKISTLNRATSIVGFGILSKKIGKQWQCNNPKCKHLW